MSRDPVYLGSEQLSKTLEMHTKDCILATSVPDIGTWTFQNVAALPDVTVRHGPATLDHGGDCASIPLLASRLASRWVIIEPGRFQPDIAYSIGVLTV